MLNYGQSVFEGMKAQRSARGRIVLFRPQENAARMRAGGARHFTKSSRVLFRRAVLCCVALPCRVRAPGGRPAECMPRSLAQAELLSWGAEPGEPAPVGRRNELAGARRRGAAEHAAAVG